MAVRSKQHDPSVLHFFVFVCKKILLAYCSIFARYDCCFVDAPIILEQNKWHMSTAIEDGVKYIARADLCLNKKQKVESFSTFKNFEIVI